MLSAEQFIPMWDVVMDDANNDDSIQQAEVRYNAMPDLSHTRSVASNLQNRAQHVDLVYGREFGGRKYSSRWWSGLRYFVYEGNVLAGAWLSETSLPGAGYTEGTVLRLLNFAQDASGFGPTASMEADFNFLDKRLSLYLQGTAAFMLTDLSSDSGDFIVLVKSVNPEVLFAIEARLTESKTKSTWQTGAEAGLRVRLKSGVEIDLAYQITGFLDVINFPDSIQVPDVIFPDVIPETFASYSTKDIVLDGFRAGIGFQF